MNIRNSSPRKRRRAHSPLGLKAKSYFDDSIRKNGNEIYTCTECGREVNGNKIHNLAIHLEKCHHEIFATISKKAKDCLPVKRLKLLQNAVEIISVNGRPFNFLLDSGYQTGIENKLRKLKEAGYVLDLKHSNLPEVKKHLCEMAEKAREKIREYVRDREVSSLVDIVTKNDRSIFAISVQFSIEGKLKIISLGLYELEKKHTAKYLASICKQCFQKYGIAVRKVITITRDNGANVSKMVREIEADSQNSSNECTQQSKSPIKNVPPNESIEVDTDIAILLATTEEISDENALALVFETALLNEHDDLLANVSTDMCDHGFDIKWDLSGISCVAHTLQLATKDGLKAMPAKDQNVIELCRRVAKMLRSSKSMHEINETEIKYKKPRLDVETRWCSTYQMVSINIRFFIYFQHL